MSLILNELIKLDIKKVEASYVSSEKNIQVKNFYEDFGFKLINEKNKK